MTNKEKNPLVKNGFFSLGVQEIQGDSNKITCIFLVHAQVGTKYLFERKKDLFKIKKIFEKVGERLKGIIERQINFDGLLEDSRTIVILHIVELLTT
ncbi:hypothetical protein NLU03_34305 [Bacillus toyonensis]|nr:hypothetical protein [Bacillus toyonensis]